jgi:hypothetical protein
MDMTQQIINKRQQSQVSNDSGLSELAQPGAADKIKTMIATGQKPAGVSDSFASALIGFLPAVVGGLFGGDAGLVAGAKSGQQAMGQLNDQQVEQQKIQQQALQEQQRLITSGILADQADATDLGKQNDQQRFLQAEGSRGNQYKLQQIAAEKSGKNTVDLNKSADDLRKELYSNKTTQASHDIVGSYNRIMETQKGGASGAGDLSLMYGYAKMLDPGSGVKEGELSTIANTKGLSDYAKQLISKVTDGEKLSPEQREEFLSKSSQLAQGQLKAQKELDNQYQGLADKRGLDASQILPSHLYKTQVYEKKQTSSSSEKPMTKAEVKAYMDARRAKAGSK